MTVETELPEVDQNQREKIEKLSLPILKVEKGDLTTTGQMKRYGYKIVEENLQYANMECERWLGHCDWAVRHNKSGKIIDVYTSY